MGGGQTHLIDLLKKIDRKQFRVFIICNDKGVYCKDFENYSDCYYAVNFRSPILCIYIIYKILLKEKPNIVHNHLLRGSILGTIAAYLAKVEKICSNLHGVIGDDKSINKIKYWFYISILGLLQQMGSRFIAVSNDMKRKLITQGIDKAKIFVLYNGVDTFKFKSYQKEDIKIPIKLIFIGRLERPKGLIYLIEAMKELESSHLTLTIVGDGGLREMLVNQVNKYQLHNIKFLGFIKDVKDLIEQHHIVVAPSLWESQGISIVEAMAMGKPVIATKVGGIPELIIHGSGGYLCEPADSKSLVEAIIKLANELENLVKFGEFNRQRVEQLFSLEKTMEQLYEVYQMD